MITIDEALEHSIRETYIPDLPEPYRGKVRDVYNLSDNKIAIIATDRISAFDHILKQPIPYKGQILNLIAAFFFEKVSDIIETHIIEVPHPNVTIARKCTPLPIEVVIRGYLTGHAWRTYKSGKRELCGVNLPEGMVENQKFNQPILTPATKAIEGHDEDISELDILRNNIVDEITWNNIRNKAFALFKRGTQIALERGLLLVDTKYEFGFYNDQLILIDEVHTPDSSRYFYADEYEERLREGNQQKQLSKEFIRQWLIDLNFQGLEGQTPPALPDSFRKQIYERYTELYKIIMGVPFQPTITKDFDAELQKLLKSYM
ncbi:MAG: phosphoribosylaminoimidazolesuccinocarboxamide synthase [Balneolales bacterium]